MNKRIITATVVGAILGVFCIIGIGYRLGFAGNEVLLFSAWFNRVLMGLVIGLVGYWKLKNVPAVLLRGAILGLIVSFSWYAATGFADATGFIAGIVYGIIIDFVATKTAK
ncbi:MAG: hypothetical protein ABH846_04555 [Patescibacteria group bacterium]